MSVLSRSSSNRSGRRWAAPAVAAALLCLVGTTAFTSALSATPRSSNGSSTGVTTNGVVKYGLDLTDGGIGDTFDPIKYNSDPFPWFRLMYDQFVYDTPHGLAPGLATKWSFPNESTIVLTLRHGVKFQDGTPFNAQAVKLSWDRVIAAKTMLKVAGIAAMESVTVDGPYKVTVTLSSPVAGDWDPRQLEDVASGLAVVSPTAVAKLGAQFSTDPIGAGAGPYELVSQTPGQDVILKRWKGYWNPSAQKLSEIEFVQVAPGAATDTALAGGAIDMALIGATDASSVRAAGLKVSSIPEDFYMTFLQFCESKPPFNNLLAREAVARVINRPVIDRVAYSNFDVATSALSPPSAPWFKLVNKLTNPDPYNLTKAEADLRKAGVAPNLTVTIIAQTTPVNTAVETLLQSQLSAIGLNVQIVPSSNAFVDNRHVLANLYYAVGSESSIDAYLLPGGVANNCNLNVPIVNSVLARKNNATLGPIQTSLAWVQLQKAFYANLPLVVLNQPTDLIAAAKNVMGIGVSRISPQYGSPNAWANIYVAK